MSPFLGPVVLEDRHNIGDLDCGDPTLDEWLRSRARRNQVQRSSRTWVITTAADQVVGFYASSAAVVLRADASKRASRNQPDPLPALLLGRLAIDQRHQGQGLGAALLKHFLLKSLEISELTGVRLLLVHAKDAPAAAFYRRHGFEPSPIDDLTMMLLITDLR